LPHRAVFTNAFLRGRRRLPEQAANRVVEAVKNLLMDPYVGTPLSEPLRGLWRLRVGDYRILYEIDAAGKRVIFHDVGHRRRIYER
jgi:mRNA interferase RelE/StbE